ncbi:helix-turn-helix domain-containing protein [Metabacillus sp. Hm71]|uniref:helix-turn-helix domain-containing protein n=1 Tax=Metabacillus sp. Hm71 TaxID=3450743 RepID=UPI003F43C8E5
MNKKIEFHIRERMHERNITQMELAEMTGIRQPSISRWVRGEVTRIEVSHLLKIAAALGISDINELITIVEE